MASFEAKVTFFRIPEFGASTAGGHFLTKSQLIIGDASFNLGIFWWPKLIGKFQLVMDYRYSKLDFRVPKILKRGVAQFNDIH